MADRKLILYACACCRGVWQDLTDERCRRAVEVAERFADGLATDEELDDASWEAEVAWDEEWDWDEWIRACRGEGILRPFPLSAAAYNVTVNPGWWGAAPAFMAPDEVIRRAVDDPEQEDAAQSALRHDIFGDPSSPSTIDPAWLTTDVTAMAHTIYNDRAFDLMPILGDALEDAGCGAAEVLSHCRSGEVHARGCWVVDGILGKS